MRNHRFFKCEHVPVSNFDISAGFWFESIFFWRLSQDFMNEKLWIRVLDLSIQYPHCNLIRENFNSGIQHTLQPPSDHYVWVLILCVKIIDDCPASQILIVNCVNYIAYLLHDKLVWLKFCSDVSKSKMAVMQKMLLNWQN